MKARIAKVQTALSSKGLYPADQIDGFAGNLTMRGIIRYHDDPISLAEFMSGPALTLCAGEEYDWPSWLVEAANHLGEREIPGAKHNNEIVQWFRDVGARWFTTDETPYCAAFVGAMFKRHGHEPPGAAIVARALLTELKPDQDPASTR